MQKFIGIPFTRHNDLLNIEREQREQKSSLGTVKQASDALVKNQETQEFLQRKHEYKEKQEDVPKTLDKEFPKKATTFLPPSSMRKRKNPVPVIKTNNFAFPIVKKFRESVKRKPRQKKAVITKNVAGLQSWKFIRED